MEQTPPTVPARGVLQPHRGTAILVLGILGLVVNMGCVGWILGLIAWVMANGDLRKMDAGVMDPEGRSMTQAGKICGIISVALAALALVVYLVMFFVFGVAILGGAAAGAGGGAGP